MYNIKYMIIEFYKIYEIHTKPCTFNRLSLRLICSSNCFTYRVTNTLARVLLLHAKIDCKTLMFILYFASCTLTCIFNDFFFLKIDSF